jgi:bifunctional non-homologous end joining protein LigD
VGTGFSDKVLLDLRHKLDERSQPEKSFDIIPRDRIDRGTRWVRPELVAQVEFGNWTADGILRHPSFQGLREDKSPRSVVRDVLLPESKPRSIAAARSDGREAHPRRQEIPDEQLAALADVQLTHPDRVLYPEQGLTKLGLATYYAEIAEWILPHLVDRPVTLVRCPEGQGGTCFYQKHAAVGTPEALERILIEDKEAKGKYLVIRDLAGLLATVQMGVLELHPWPARTDNLLRPDRMIIDLDPDPELPWGDVVAAAQRVYELLNDLGLVSFLKTTGGKGLHIVVPLARRHEWEDMKDFSEAIVRRLAGDEPRRFTVNMSKRARPGKVYLDFHRNSRGATAVAAYSTRARPGATVSTPLAWDELSAAIGPDHFRVDNLPGRLASLDEDPWAEIDAIRQSITLQMKKRLR